jgi:hypothetical protein
MDDRDNTQPELPVLRYGPTHRSPESSMPERAGNALDASQPGVPESGYDPYNSAA